MNRTKLMKWGNSQGVLIPKSIINQLAVKIGDEFSLEVKDSNIIISPISRRKSVAQRFAEYDGPIELTEMDWKGAPVGKEYTW